jgi:hypothetical protein
MRCAYFIAVCAALLTASQAELTLTHLHPAGLQLGTTTNVKLTGKFAPWPCQVWVDAPGITFVAAKDAGKFDVTINADAKPGPHLFRVFDADTVSAPISLYVAATPQTLEQEPNDDFHAPQILSGSTATINGKLDKSDDVDSFQVALKQGQTMVAWVEAYVLAAGFDAMLRVVDSRGTTLAFNHDGPANMDPFLVFTAPADGNYIVQTMGQKYPASSDIHFTGGEDCVYRLHVSTEQSVRHTWPLAIQRGKKTLVDLDGWNLASPQMEIEEASTLPFPMTFSDIPELTETAEPQSLTIPSAISGRIDPPGDEDQFTFTTTKDTALELSLNDPSNSSSMDGWLKIRNAEGKELATNDDAGGTNDPKILWTAPADGTYSAVVGEVTQRGGKDFIYRLQLQPAIPTVTATIAEHSAKVEAGKTAELKVTVTPTKGFQPKLKLRAHQLPAGITANEVEVPEKGGAVTLTLTAEPTAPAAAQPFQLSLREVEGGKEYPVKFAMVTTSENNGVPQGYQQLLINDTIQVWLTVRPAPPP